MSISPQNQYGGSILGDLTAETSSIQDSAESSNIDIEIRGKDMNTEETSKQHSMRRKLVRQLPLCRQRRSFFPRNSRPCRLELPSTRQKIRLRGMSWDLPRPRQYLCQRVLQTSSPRLCKTLPDP